jgi:pimeloyl-ACP methyl ester carboxylesterase
LHNPRVGRIVLVDAVGLKIDEFPIVDFFSLDMTQIADLSYFNPDAFRIDMSGMTDEQKAIIAGNRAPIMQYAGTSMADPTLLGRLPSITIPTLVIWGAAGRIVTPHHGETYAKAIPGAELQVIADAGHLPQLETPESLLQLVRAFVDADAVAAASDER